MLFLMYWEMRESLSSQERLKVASTLTDSTLFSANNVEIIRWEPSSDGCDVLLVEAESAADVTNALSALQTAAPGAFKFTKTAPVGQAGDAISGAQHLEPS